MDTIISKISCPRCQSFNLYKFGKDVNGFQKYLCRNCNHQFSTGSKSRVYLDSKYFKCPRCNKAMFLHHQYQYYTDFRCRSCGHSVKQPKPFPISDPSSALLFGKSSFSGMRFPLFVIISALNMFYVLNASTRKISQYLFLNNSIKVSHVTIAFWTKKFAPLFKSISDKLSSNIDLASSDEWHADETVVFINGVRYYIWFIIDSETRFIIDFHLSPYRDSDQAFILFNKATKFGSPRSIVTDRFGPYIMPARTLFPNTKHIQVESFKDDISNNLIEAFNGQFKSWYKSKRGFNSFNSANNLISTYVFFFNFIRPHSSLNKLAPAQVAGVSYDDKAKSFWLISA